MLKYQERKEGTTAFALQVCFYDKEGLWVKIALIILSNCIYFIFLEDEPQTY
jgi:hypothetical protein